MPPEQPNPSLYPDQQAQTGGQSLLGGGAEVPMGGEEDPQQIKAQIRQMVSQMPPEQLQQIVQNPEQAMEQLTQQIMQLEEVGGDEVLALGIAQKIIEEALDFAQETQNQTLEMMNPNIMPQEGQEGMQAGMGQPAGQPMGQPQMPAGQGQPSLYNMGGQ